MLDQIQEQLEILYDTRGELRAGMFLVDRACARQLGGRGEREELLVLESDGQLELALYLDPVLLERWKSLEGRPAAQLLEGDLDGFCQLVEGVSHLLYLVRAATDGRQVSLLELEGQAEVDKFAVCLLRRWREGGEAWARQLLVRLFDQVQLSPHLTGPERWRYQEASRLSRRYCESLLPLVKRGRLDRLLTALRYSYRLGAEAKLRHWAQAA